MAGRGGKASGPGKNLQCLLKPSAQQPWAGSLGVPPKKLVTNSCNFLAHPRPNGWWLMAEGGPASREWGSQSMEGVPQCASAFEDPLLFTLFHHMLLIL